jgi:cytochrome-b5 reductase
MSKSQGLIECRIISKEQKNYNVIKLGLRPLVDMAPPSVSFFIFIHPDPDRPLFRPYSPLRVVDNTLELLIKVYEHGDVSRLINEKSVGDVLYISEFKDKLRYKPGLYDSILMIAGGTGLTPMLQILNEDHRLGTRTRFTLLLCNSTKDDIFGVEELAGCGEKLELIHIVSQLEKEEDNLLRGRISLEIIKKVSMRERSGRFDFVYVCGPPGMMEAVSGDKNEDKTQGTLRGYLAGCGYESRNVYKL